MSVLRKEAIPEGISTGKNKHICAEQTTVDITAEIRRGLIGTSEKLPNFSIDGKNLRYEFG